MEVFLTGGTGFIGQSLTKMLLARGWSVTALVRKPDTQRAQALRKMGARLATGDVTVRESMRASMSGAEIVLHNAGHYEYGMGSAGNLCMHNVNVAGTENVLRLAHELGVTRTVYVSSLQAFGETGPQPRDETYTRQFPCRTSYEQSKTDAHEIARQYQQRGLPLIIVCPHQVIGANDHSAIGYFQRLYVNRLMPPMGWAPTCIFCCVELNDLAEGIALAAEKGKIGETYFLSGDPQTYREVIRCWSKKPGAFIPRLWLPAWLAAAFFAPLEPLQRRLGLPAFLSRETVRATSMNWNYSSAKAQQELGWTHCSAETMWFAALDGEIQLLAKRRARNLVQRLKPLETIE
jgi:dihydroflavonol-4-reductase